MPPVVKLSEYVIEEAKNKQENHGLTRCLSVIILIIFFCSIEQIDLELVQRRFLQQCAALSRYSVFDTPASCIKETDVYPVNSTEKHYITLEKTDGVLNIGYDYQTSHAINQFS